MKCLLALCLTIGLAAPSLASTLVVCNKYEGTVSFIDLQSGEEVARPKTGLSPHEVALSPDNKLAVVVSYLEDGYVGQELNVFDIATAQIVKTIPIGPHLAPHGIKWIGDTNRVLVTTEETRDVIKVDIDAGKVIGAVPTAQIGSHLLALSPDATRAYVTSRGSDSVSVIDVEKMQLLQTIRANQGPEGVDVSPDGKQLWVGNNQSQDIIVFDAKTMHRIAEIDAGFLPIRVLFAPDGKTVAVADLRGDRVVIYDAAKLEPLAQIDLEPAGAKGPASLLFSPDGAHLYAGAQDGARVVEIDTKDWSLTRVFEAGDGSDGLAISPVQVNP